MPGGEKVEGAISTKLVSWKIIGKLKILKNSKYDKNTQEH